MLSRIAQLSIGPAAGVFIAGALALGYVPAHFGVAPWVQTLPAAAGFLAVVSLLYVVAIDVAFDSGAKRRLMGRTIARTLLTTGVFALLAAAMTAGAAYVPTHGRRAVFGVLALAIWGMMMAEAAWVRALYGRPYPLAFAVGLVARVGGGWLTWQGLAYFMPQAPGILSRYL